MSLIAIGPVSVSHGNPELSWSSSPTAHGIRPCTIAGSVSWAAAHQLSELIANPAERVTVGGRTGVQEWLEFDDDLLGPMTGYYVLEGFELAASQPWSMATSDVPISIAAAYLGDLV